MTGENLRWDAWRHPGVLSGAAVLTSLVLATWLLADTGYPRLLQRAGGWAGSSALGVPAPAVTPSPVPPARAGGATAGSGAATAGAPAVVGTAYWVLGGFDDGPLVRVDSATGATVTIPVDDQAQAVLPAFGSVWVAGDDGVQQVDPVAGRVVDHVELVGGASALVSDGARVWARTGARVVAFDPVGLVVTKTLDVGSTTGDLAWDGHLLWVVDLAAATVDGYDPLTGSRRRTVPVGIRPDRLVFDGASLWVTSTTADRVVQVDPLGTSQRSIVLGPSSPAWAGNRVVMAVIAGNLWLTRPGRDGAWWLARVDRSSGRVSDEVRLGCCTSNLTGSATELWVQVAASIRRVDLSTRTATTVWGSG